MISAAKIESILSEKGMTWYQLGQKSGVSRDVIYLIKSKRKKNTTLKTTMAVAKVLGVSVADIIEEEG